MIARALLCLKEQSRRRTLLKTELTSIVLSDDGIYMLIVPRDVHMTSRFADARYTCGRRQRSTTSIVARLIKNRSRDFHLRSINFEIDSAKNSTCPTQTSNFKITRKDTVFLIKISLRRVR